MKTPMEFAKDIVALGPCIHPPGEGDGRECPLCVVVVVVQAIAQERARCRRIANRYEKGPEEQARVAGTIRAQIEVP